ncbi:GNAT family N-acetyltransferase [Alkalibacillus haloalkaliphilus]|uniref:Acetyltransferase n=1 Tax=Alkalibacillus haloalkaliphilus TaxID=94136 RepID=A0A511W9W9_9BACI|nr:GNAT family protein [Alkalibacillus haloalkaliphilus]GEN46873.1 acetyltransferase [Alkalibacillus haloalkaliphilus]
MKIEDVYSDFPTLETDRLKIRKLTMDDVEDINKYTSKDEVSQYVSWNTHQSLDDTKDFVQFALDQYQKHDVAPFGIELKETGKIIGTVDYIWWKPAHQKAEIGYVLSDQYWSNGIMTEAVQELIKFGFENMDLVRIEARCFAENKGSERVMQKVGMTYEGTLRKSMFVKGHYKDLKMYAILKEDYESMTK